MDNYSIQETTVWGDAYKANSPENILRCGTKNEILQTSYPFIDHYTIYALKSINQRGPAKESQTFIVSYVYIYDDYIGDREQEFIQKLNSIQLRFHKELCIFRGKAAYKILIMDTDVDLNTVLRLIQVPHN
jgi:hypothetical protein